MFFIDFMILFLSEFKNNCKFTNTKSIKTHLSCLIFGFSLKLVFITFWI